MQGQHIIKSLLLGNVEVGKTAFLKRIVYNIFSEKYKGTIGVDFCLYSQDKFNFQLWDVAGEELYGTMLKIYMLNSAVCFIFCDATNIKSIFNVKKWLNIFRNIYDTTKKYPCYLVITKMDLVYDNAGNYSGNIDILDILTKECRDDFQAIFRISNKQDKIYNEEGVALELRVNSIMSFVTQDLEKNYFTDPTFNIFSKESPQTDRMLLKDRITSTISYQPDISKMLSIGIVAQDYLRKIKLDLTPYALMSADDTYFLSCYKVMENIISQMTLEAGSSFTYKYDTRMDNEMIKNVIEMLENRSFKCLIDVTSMVILRQ